MMIIYFKYEKKHLAHPDVIQQSQHLPAAFDPSYYYYFSKITIFKSQENI